MSNDGEHPPTYRAPYATFVVQHDDAVIRVAARGEVDLSAAAALDDVVGLVRRLMESSPPSIELDLSAVAFLDAAGIPFIMALAGLAARAEGHFGIRDPQPHVRRLLDIVGLERHVARE